MSWKYHASKANWLGVLCMLLSCIWLVQPEVVLAGGTNHCVSPQLPASLNLLANVNGNVGIGEEIPGSRQSATLEINCNGHYDDDRPNCTSSTGWAFIPDSGVSTNTSIPNTYRFSNFPPGVGYQALDMNDRPMPLSGPAHDRHDTKVHIRQGYQQVPLAFRLIKLDDSIPLSSDFGFRFRVACQNNEFANVDGANSRVLINAHLNTVTQTCEMENPDIQITLPTISSGQFDSMGDTGGNTPFSLRLNCMKDARAKVFFSDVNNLPNSTSVLTPGVNTNVGGVSFRMLHAGEPVKMVPGGAVNGSGTFIDINTFDGNEHISIPLEVEYIQVTPDVRAGRVEAQAMVTISYE